VVFSKLLWNKPGAMSKMGHWFATISFLGSDPNSFLLVSGEKPGSKLIVDRGKNSEN